MFKDELILQIKAGDGGNGSNQFLREKYVPKGGPSGGNGGNGGNIYVRCMNNLNSLAHYHNNQIIKADDGEHGKGNSRYGKSGKDKIIKVPCGTFIKDFINKKKIVFMEKPNQSFLLEKGGKGGKGNVCFKSSVKQTPQLAQLGEKKETRSYLFKLKIISNIGLIGFPNIRKSSLLKNLSKSKARVANYPFTTLIPNLGIYYPNEWSTLTIADIPGIIEDAEKGKGLGIRFLKHIEKSQSLCILLDFSKDKKTILAEYYLILKAIKAYKIKILKQKMFFIVGTKIDLINNKKKESILKMIQDTIDKEIGLKKQQILGIYSISNITQEGVDALKSAFNNFYNKYLI